MRECGITCYDMIIGGQVAKKGYTVYVVYIC